MGSGEKPSWAGQRFHSDQGNRRAPRGLAIHGSVRLNSRAAAERHARNLCHRLWPQNGRRDEFNDGDPNDNSPRAQLFVWAIVGAGNSSSIPASTRLAQTGPRSTAAGEGLKAWAAIPKHRERLVTHYIRPYRQYQRFRVPISLADCRDGVCHRRLNVQAPGVFLSRPRRRDRGQGVEPLTFHDGDDEAPGSSCISSADIKGRMRARDERRGHVVMPGRQPITRISSKAGGFRSSIMSATCSRLTGGHFRRLRVRKSHLPATIRWCGALSAARRPEGGWCASTRAAGD